MKTIAALFAALIVLYSIYYDVTVGTIPSKYTPVFVFENQAPSDESFMMIEIKPGDTVISVIEKMEQGPLPVSIEQVIRDFKELNPNIDPVQIQPGKKYKFPFYKASGQ